MRKSILFLGDIAMLYGALLLTLIFRYGNEYQIHLSVHLIPFTIIFAVWVLVFYIANLYELSAIKNSFLSFANFLYAMLINIALAITFLYLTPSIAIAPRRNLFIFIIVALVLEIGWRLFYNQLLIWTGYRNNTLIIGASDQSQELYDYLLANPQLGFNALGMIDIKSEAAASTLEKVISQQEVKTLVIAREVYDLPALIEVLYRLVPLKLKFYSLSKFSERITGKIPLSSIDQTWFLDNLSEGNRRGYEMAKRLFDILGAAILIILSTPAWLILPLANIIYAPGPLLYRQIRQGRTGKKIAIIKFRTMIPNAETDGAQWAKKNDIRVTKIGNFLRKTRLDELPQLWNVLKGDLSLVGPRPERPEFHGQLSSAIPFYNERYLIKPGLMGWAQLKYSYGASVQDTIEKLQYDLYYVKNRSLLLDFSIILRTLNIVIRQAGR